LAALDGAVLFAVVARAARSPRCHDDEEVLHIRPDLDPNKRRPSLERKGDVMDPVPRSSLRPLVAYFLLTFAITWGLILGFLGSKGFRLAEVTREDALLLFAFMLAGPCVSGLLLTWRTDGRSGLAGLAARIRRWPVPMSWFALAIGTNPIVLLVILTALTLVVSPSFAPGFQPIGLAIGLIAGCVEEIGWTGFATPRLVARWSPVRSGLILGMLWASWHALADFAGNGAAMGSAWLPYFLVYWLVTLTAYRVLMTIVYAHTGSVLVAMLMHASYTGWQLTLSPATSGSESFIWQSAFAVAMVIVTAVVVAREGRAGFSVPRITQSAPEGSRGLS
jgi:membrane protease YdiL (CAAX protease family)